MLIVKRTAKIKIKSQQRFFVPTKKDIYFIIHKTIPTVI